MKQLHMAQTSPDHLLTSLTVKKNTKSNESLHTDSSDDQNGFNTSSNGKDTPKVTTHGSQLTRSMPLNLSSITDPQQFLSHPHSTISQQPRRCITQHHSNCILKPYESYPNSLSNAQRSSPLPYQTASKRLPNQRPYSPQTLQIRLRPLRTPLPQYLPLPLQAWDRPRINTSLVL